MKLSLRYLLAYLDDILNPADTAEVSRLLKEDRPAEELVQRIGDVVRKRRVSAPDPFDETPGKDANDVAEYLDNLLSPEEIRQFEQHCLDSDELLAEAAVSHQILTLVLGGAGNVPASTRKQLEKIANSVSDEHPVKPSGIAPIPLSAVDIPTVDSPAVEHSSASEIPTTFELPQRDSNWKKSGVFVALGLLFAAWVYSIATDPSFQNSYQGNRQQPIPNQLADNQNDQNGTKLQQADLPVPGTKPEPSINETVPVAKSPTVGTTTKDPREFLPPVVPTTKTPGPASQPDDKTLVMNNKAGNPVAPGDNGSVKVAGKSGEVKPVEKIAKPVPPKPAEPICVTPSIAYVSENQTIIRQAVGQSTAMLISTMTEIEAGDQIFCIQHTDAEFSIGQGQGNLKLLENTSLKLLGADEKSCFGFDVKQGRLIFTFQLGLEQDAPKRIRLVVQQQPWYFEFPDTAGTIAIEVTPQHSTHYEQLPIQGLVVASVWVAGKPIRLLPPGGKWEELKQAKQLLPIATSSQTEPAQKQPASTASLSAIPEWSAQISRKLSVSQTRNQREFVKKITDSVNLWLDLEGVVNDPNPHIAQLAAQALALGNRIETLVTVLAHSQHEESRTAAITGLRIWLPQLPENRDILQSLLAKTVNKSTAFVVYHLLWGYDKTDARDSELSRQLVNWLRHDHVAVRELSIYWISQLTGQKLGYRPLAPLGTREQGVIAWERHLARNGALVSAKE